MSKSVFYLWVAATACTGLHQKFLLVCARALVLVPREPVRALARLA